MVSLQLVEVSCYVIIEPAENVLQQQGVALLVVSDNQKRVHFTRSVAA